ncbi:BppU family phage baseplate upper protein [Clostridium perfringens]|nr:BppU family phage baseplate upper protein [Clostridium perfringens]
MSEIGLNINVDSYNNEGIKTIKGNNNAEIYKLYILKNKRRLSLVGKTVKLGYVMVGTTNGDVIENLNITNAEQGEITLPITNRISKKDGVYSCQLAIYGADGFLEHTATFGLTVEANIFTKIAVEIADSKDFTYLENILDKASKLSEKLKENTSSANNANSNLESNITEANNINSKLLENTSTATSLNKNLESNIDLAKEVKETIKDLDAKNTEATSNIGQLTDLNNKATELSNNIQQGLPLNAELVRNTESAKVTNTNLAATNQEAVSKNTELQASLEKTKEFINGLDGSQNIPQLRLDVTELQNGLKSNQALAYQGASISANNTLEGRTEGMKIEGKTMYKKKDGTYTDTWEEGVTLESFGEKEGNKISILSHGKNLLNINDFYNKLYSIDKQNIKEVVEENRQCFSLDNNSAYYKNGYTCNFKENTQYTLQGYFKQKSGNSLMLTINYTDGTYQEFRGEMNMISFKFFKVTTQPNKTVKFIGGAYTDGTKLYIDKETLMLEEGTQATQYESYKCDKKDILIKEPLHESNYLYEDNGQVKVYEKKKKYTFTGDERIELSGTQPSDTKYLRFFIEGLDNIKKWSGLNVMCNNLPTVQLTSKPNLEGIYVSNTVDIKILKSKLTTPDVNGFKTWLKANPTKIVYQLAEPTTEIVENCVDIDLDTFGEKTYFNIENSIKGSLDFKVPSNIASIVQSNSKAINELYNLIDTLVLPNILQNTTDIEMLKLEKLK